MSDVSVLALVLTSDLSSTAEVSSSSPTAAAVTSLASSFCCAASTLSVSCALDPCVAACVSKSAKSWLTFTAVGLASSVATSFVPDSPLGTTGCGFTTNATGSAFASSASIPSDDSSGLNTSSKVTSITSAPNSSDRDSTRRTDGEPPSVDSVAITSVESASLPGAFSDSTTKSRPVGKMKLNTSSVLPFSTRCTTSPDSTSFTTNTSGCASTSVPSAFRLNTTTSSSRMSLPSMNTSNSSRSPLLTSRRVAK